VDDVEEDFARRSGQKRFWPLKDVPARVLLPNLVTLLALGRIAHDAILDALGLKKRDFPFAHGAKHALPCGLTLFDSYHCSRQNTNTGRLTEAMFEKVVSAAAASLS
jgi:uracil-DNA glycosylase